MEGGTYSFFEFVMMIKYIVSMCLLTPFMLSGQNMEPWTKFTLYFEDAKENKDSVIVGYDTMAHSYIDPIFGEIDITGQPYDSILECRTGRIKEFLSKVGVVYYNPLWCSDPTWVYPQYLTINIHAKHLPVTIRWDKDYFLDDCRDWTLFTRNWGYTLHPGWSNGRIVRLVEQSELVLTQTYLDETETFNTSHPHLLEGGDKGTVYILFLGLAHTEPANAVHGATALPLSIHPNPAQSWIEVTWPSDAAPVALWRIRDSLGRAVSQSSTGDRNGIHDPWRLDVSHLPAGTYWLQAYARDGQMALAQFVKA